MRILYVASDSNWGGGSVALFNLIKGIKSYGHQLYVIFPSSNGIFCNKLSEVGISFTAFRYELTIKPQTHNTLKYITKFAIILLERFYAGIRIKRIISEFQPDLVHTNVGPLDIAVKAAKRAGIPHVWHLREYQDLDSNLTFLMGRERFVRMLHAENNYNIAITKGVFNHFSLRPGLDRVIYDGVFEKSQIRNVVDGERFFFLFVGRIEEAKGVIELLEAFSLYCEKKKDATLLLAGANFDDFYYKKCINFINSHKLTNNVDFLGERSDVYDLMSKSIATIVPSRSEGFGFITVEAMLNGSIVIGKNVSGTKEQFDNGLEKSGDEIGIRYSTTDELAQAFAYVENRDMSEMRKRAREVVLDLYPADRHISLVRNYYQFVIENHRIKMRKNE